MFDRRLRYRSQKNFYKNHFFTNISLRWVLFDKLRPKTYVFPKYLLS
jgi:hypothetical protein